VSLPNDRDPGSNVSDSPVEVGADGGAWEEESVYEGLGPDGKPHPTDLAGQLEMERQRYIRLAADFANFRKRIERHRDQLILYATEALAKELLPVLDDLERAVETSSPGGEDASGRLREGVALIIERFRGVLEKNGIKGFSSLGQIFDPTLHEALLPRADESEPPNAVLEEFERGYLMHGRLLRAAKVVVNQIRKPAPPKVDMTVTLPPPQPIDETLAPVAGETGSDDLVSLTDLCAALPADAMEPAEEVLEQIGVSEQEDVLSEEDVEFSEEEIAFLDGEEIETSGEGRPIDEQEPSASGVIIIDDSDVGSLEDWEADFGED
jgi:molecular chaperone GrpE